MVCMGAESRESIDKSGLGGAIGVTGWGVENNYNYRG